MTKAEMAREHCDFLKRLRVVIDDVGSTLIAVGPLDEAAQLAHARIAIDGAILRYKAISQDISQGGAAMKNRTRASK